MEQQITKCVDRAEKEVFTQAKRIIILQMNSSIYSHVWKEN